MTEEIPMRGKATYFLEQFIKHTTPEVRERLLVEYGLLESTPYIQPKALKRGESIDLSDKESREEIVLEKARKWDLEILSIETVDDPSVEHVEEQIRLMIRHDGVEVRIDIVSERDTSQSGVEPVTDEWFTQSVETMLTHSLGKYD
jgi:hypothetical protein